MDQSPLPLLFVCVFSLSASIVYPRGDVAPLLQDQPAHGSHDHLLQSQPDPALPQSVTPSQQSQKSVLLIPNLPDQSQTQPPVSSPHPLPDNAQAPHPAYFQPQNIAVSPTPTPSPPPTNTDIDIIINFANPHPPHKENNINIGMKIGFLFIGIAVILQGCIFISLMLKRRQLFKPGQY